MKHFISAVKDNFANFNGRASREEFWMFILFYMIFSILLQVIDVALGITGTLSSIYGLALFVPSLAAYVRRLHDSDNSGHWLWLFLTIIGAFWILFLLVKPSSEGENKYDIPKSI
jgi:uncharacterized membrane protein YhaH (DUF805 family)